MAEFGARLDVFKIEIEDKTITKEKVLTEEERIFKEEKALKKLQLLDPKATKARAKTEYITTVEHNITQIANPLIKLIQLKEEEYVHTLLFKLKSDPNIIDPYGRTPLHHAISNSNVGSNASFELERLLILAGASTEI